MMKFGIPFKRGPVTDLIYRQLSIVFLLSILLIVFGFSLSVNGLNQINSQTRQIIEVNNQKLQFARAML
jgi:hypothetical protein